MEPHSKHKDINMPRTENNVFSRALNENPSFAKKMYNKNICTIDTDFIYYCTNPFLKNDATKQTINISTEILKDIFENVYFGIKIPVSEQMYMFTSFMTLIMSKYFDDLEHIAQLMITYNEVDVNTYYLSDPVLTYLLKYYPKSITVNKVKFLLRNGYDMTLKNSETAQKTKLTSLGSFTNDIDIDVYIDILNTIKKFGT
jgi:hypothetical protein